MLRHRATLARPRAQPDEAAARQARTGRGSIAVLMASSYPASHCGVSHYVRELADHMPSGVTVTHLTLDLRAGIPVYITQSLLAGASLLRRAPDVLHVQYTPTTAGPSALPLAALARLRGVSVCVTAHERPSTYARRLPAPARVLFRLFERALFRLAGRVLVLSGAHGEELLTEYATPSDFVHLGVREEPRVRLLDSSTPTVTVAGFIRPGKGIEDAIVAAPALAERLGGAVCVQVVGSVEPRDRQYADDLKRRAEENARPGCDVTFVEGADAAEFERLITSSDVYVFPSRTASQSITMNLVLEARIPVVCSSATGVAEIVREHGLGAIYPPGDVEALVRSVASLLDDPGAYAACQANIERFTRIASWREVSGVHAATYQELRAA